jgi:RHS repeat-associated protein
MSRPSLALRAWITLSSQRLAVIALLLLGLVGMSWAGGRATAADPGPDRVEVPELRTATTKTFRHSDGRITKALYAGPVHYQEGGEWRTIDPRLTAAAPNERASGFGWRMKSHRFNVLVKEQLEGGHLRVDTAGRRLGLTLEGAQRRPATARGAHVRFDEALPEVDLRYTVRPDGVKEELLLKDGSAPARYSFVLDPGEGDLVADELPGGDWAFRARRGGRPLFVIAAPFATDAPAERTRDGAATRRQPRDQASHVQMSVEKAGDRFAIELAVDEAWLRDDARRFPVTVDPTIVFQPSSKSAEWEVGCSTCEGFNYDAQWIGSDDYAAYRSAFQFDLSAIPPSAVVTAAKFGLWNQADTCIWTSTGFCGDRSHTLNVHQMTKAWTPDVTTLGALGWNTTAASTYTLPIGAAGNWMTWDVTALAKDWVSGVAPNHGMLVKRSTEPLDVGGPEVPTDTWYGDPTLRPKIEVTYTSNAVRLHEPETLHGNGADLRWDRWEGDPGATFSGYEVHRAAGTGFTPSASTRIASISDVNTTTYRDTTAAPSTTFTYKVVTSGDASVGRTVALPAAGQASKVLQPDGSRGTATFIDDADGSTSCANYGRDLILNVGNDTYRERSLLSFDLRDIPAGASVASATLSTHLESSPTGSLTVGVHRATAGWTEGTSDWGDCTGDGASWAHRSGGVPWTSPGGDYVATPAATKAHTASDLPGWDSFDVSSIVRGWVGGSSPNHGFLLRATDETVSLNKSAWLSYHSDDHGQASLRPKLAVTYSDPTADAVGPTVAISSPAAGDRVRNTVDVVAAASDDRRVDKVEFLVDGVLKGTDTAAPYSYAWDTKTAANGTRSLTARATDDAGNVKTSAAVGVTVANSAPPTTRVTSPSARYDDLVKGDSPAVYWRLGEAAGATTAADASGNARPGTYGGDRTHAVTGLLTGDTDKAVSLLNQLKSNTLDGRVSAGLSGLLGTALTAEAWVSYGALATNGTENRVWSRNWGTAGGWRLSVARNGAGQQVAELAINKAGVVTTAASVVTPGKLHLAGTYDGSTMRLYVNGQQTASAALAAAPLNTTATVYLGQAITGTTTVDDAALYGRAVSAQELRAHHDAGSGRPVTISGTHTVQAAAADDGSVTKVEFYADGNRFGEDTTAPYSASLSTLGAEPVYDGTHTLTTRAYDDHGQVTTSADTSVVVANASGSKYLADIASTAVPQAVTYDPSAAAQDKHGLDVTVTNRSAQTWSATDVVVRPRWLSPDPAAQAVLGAEVPLGVALAPGAAKTVRVLVEAPALPEGVDKAQYRLQVDVFEKSTTTFFADKGNKPLENPVIVNKALLTGLGLEKWWHYDAERLGSGMQHLVNVANGNSLLRWTPFSSTGRGLSTVVDITYNSLEKKSESPIGNNFSLSISGLTRFGNPIDIHPNKADEIAGRANRFVEITDGDGTTHRFVGKQAADGSVYWEEPAGVHLFLRSLPEGDPRGRWALTRPDRVTFYYDVDGYPLSVQDANRNTLRYTLEDTPPSQDPGGPKKRITAITDAGGRAFNVAYWTKEEAKKAHVRGKVKRITDHTGSALDFEYYEDGNLLRMIQRGGTNADGTALADRSFVFTYTTSNGDGPAIPAAADRVSPDPKTPNQSTRLYSVRDPLGRETTFTYLGPGHGQDRWKLASRSDRRNQPTTFAYDIVNRVTTVTDPIGRATKYAYDVEGKVTSITNALAQRTLVEWTGDRHVGKVTAPNGTTQRYAYDANGYLTHEWDQLNRLTELKYDYPAVDGNDLPGKWKAGRTVAHVSQLASRTTRRGKVWRFGYDEGTQNPDDRGNLTSVTDPESSVTRHDYNDDGTRKQTTDPLGHVTRYTSYDANGLPTEMVKDMDGVDGTSAQDRVTRFGHDADGLLRWIQDPEHVNDTGADEREYRATFDYDSFHRMGRQSAPKSTRHDRGQLIWSGARFDANDNLVAKLGQHQSEDWAPEKSSISERSYDAMDELVESIRPHAQNAAADTLERTTMELDLVGRVKKTTSPLGNRTPANANDFAIAYDYDALDRVVRHTRTGDPGDGTSQTRITHRCYDLAGDLRSVTMPRAKLASVTCGTDGAPAGTPTTRRMEYNAVHEQTAAIDANGIRTSQTFDADGNLESRTDAHGSKQTREYNGRGDLVKVTKPFQGGTSPRNVVKRFEYDAAGHVKRIISPRAYDSAGGEGASYSSYVMTLERNAANQIVKKTLPDDASTDQAYEHTKYDLNGREVKATLPVTQATLAEAEQAEPGSIRETSYFDTGWVRWTEDENPRISYDYTAEGWQKERVPSFEDGRPNTDRRSWKEYHEDGLVKVEYDRAGKPTEYRYDANNNLTYAFDKSVEDDKQKPIETTVTYDGFDELATTLIEQEGEEDRFGTFVYDENGNVRKRTDDKETNAAGTVTRQPRRHEFTYDPGDRMTLQQDFGRKDEASDDREIRMDYFDTGWKKRRVIARHVDAAMRDMQTTDWTYELNGQLKTLVTKARPKTSDTWETKESHDVEYVRDGVYLNGHRTSDRWQRESPKTDASCRTSPCTQTFTYDARDRLTKEDNGGGTTRTYELDAAGNPTKETGGPEGTVTADYTGGQLEWQEVAGVKAYQHYDDWGNLDCVTKSVDNDGLCAGAQSSSRDANVVQDYTYDPNDNLLAFDDFVDHKSTDYVNDAFDRPVEERERQGTDTPKTKLYTYLGLSDQVSDEDEFGGTDTSGTPKKTRAYSYDADGQRISMTYENKQGTAGPKEFGYSHDAQGSVSMLINDSGKAQASYGYTAYGQPDDTQTQENDPDSTGQVDQKKDALNPYRFTDKRWSPVSEQMDMGARRFSPSMHSFIQDDRYEDALDDLRLSSDPLTQNRYSLAGGNPVSFVETDGHEFDPIGAVEDGAEALGDVGEDAVNTAADVGVGFGKGLYDSGDALYQMGKAYYEDPVGTWKANMEAQAQMIRDPIGSAKTIANEFTRGYKEGGVAEGIGRGLSEVVGGPAKLVAGGAKVSKAMRAMNAVSCNSFTPSTRVRMANGTTKRLSEVRVGDRVLATDPATGRAVARPVKDVIVGYGAKRLVRVTVDGRTTTATAGHPFWVESRGEWVLAEDLREGDVLRTSAGSLVRIDGVEVREVADQLVLNLTVGTTHTYHAGPQLVLVHNAKRCGSGGGEDHDDADKTDTLRPGPHAGEGVPVDKVGAKPTKAQQAEVDRQFAEHGCHTCGKKDSGKKDPNSAVFDHQPSTRLGPDRQRGYPHCLDCSRRQGGQVRRILAKGLGWLFGGRR